MGIHRVNFTISDEADKLLDELAAEDALGRRPNRSATLERLIVEERDRRRRRKTRQEAEGPPRR
ncbi:hypothetical protein [Sorangium sp. So ce131]|uniref:hypothetical protein n=1 Tax=Sorangium sp. So ce131 TaxID=3133282 RepID=UPI003F605664